MAGIDTVTTFFDQLDNMEAEFRLHNLGYLVRILQIECHIRIFRYPVSYTHLDVYKRQGKCFPSSLNTG